MPLDAHVPAAAAGDHPRVRSAAPRHAAAFARTRRMVPRRRCASPARTAALGRTQEGAATLRRWMSRRLVRSVLCRCPLRGAALCGAKHNARSPQSRIAVSRQYSC
jgi:hypothetical protein